MKTYSYWVLLFSFIALVIVILDKLVFNLMSLRTTIMYLISLSILIVSSFYFNCKEKKTMIVKIKNKQLASCLCCGGYNMQPKLNTGIRFAECGDVYSYLISNIVEIRLCNKCARELKRELEKQINGKEEGK